MTAKHIHFNPQTPKFQLELAKTVARTHVLDVMGGHAFNKNFKKKIGGMTAFKLAHVNHLGGQLLILNALRDLHFEKPFESVDEMLGQIHIWEEEVANKFQELYAYKVIDRTSVEKMAKEDAKDGRESTCL